MKIAIVHDYLNQFGGAERVVSALHEIFPDAPIYTSIYDENKMPDNFKQMDIRTSFMQKLPLISDFHRFYFWLYPFAFDLFDLSEYDVILSSSSAFAKGIRKTKGQLHICYCYTPMRFVWRYEDYVKRERFGNLTKSLLPLILRPLKYWDLENNKQVDRFIAISKTIHDRIKEIYGRESAIIYPPVECRLFQPSKIDLDYFLVVSRLNTYKRIDVVVEAFNRLELPLKIVGGGPDLKNLKKIAGPNTEFLGRLSDRELKRYMAECRALVFPGEEDFGIVPLEAMACGRPVIAYKIGGAVETVVEGETGLFFEEQTVESLMQTVAAFQFRNFNKNRIRQHAFAFDKEVFKDNMKKIINKIMQERT